MNKKGQTLDNIWIIVIFFALAIFLFTAQILWNVLSTEANELWDNNPTSTSIKGNMESASNTFDFIGVMAWFALHIGILVTVYLLRSHPIIYVAAIFIIAILTLIAAPLSNAYGDLRTNSDTYVTAAMDEMPMTNFIMSHLPKFEVIFGFLTAIVMFSTAKMEGVF